MDGSEDREWARDGRVGRSTCFATGLPTRFSVVLASFS